MASVDILLPAAASDTLQDTSSCSSDITNKLHSSPKPTSPFLTLASELHIQILSYLSITDQLRASKTCTLWQTLLLNTKSLQRSRYRSKTDIPSQFVKAHKILSFINYTVSATPKSLPGGLLFRIENRKIKEFVYYDVTSKDLMDPESYTLIDLPLPSTAFLEERAFQTLAQDIDPMYGNQNQIKVMLYSKKCNFIYNTGWEKLYDLNQTPTTKELLETIIVEASEELEIEWDFYREYSDLIICGASNSQKEGYWVAVNLMQDLHAKFILHVCLMRVQLS